MSVANECRSPGYCTCPDMKRCPWCGYTAHDEAHLMDHRLCANAGHRMDASSVTSPATAHETIAEMRREAVEAEAERRVPPQGPYRTKGKP